MRLILTVIACFMLAASAHAKTFNSVPEQSTLVFAVNHHLGYTVGAFQDFKAAFQLSDDMKEIISVRADVKTASINTRNLIRDEGLKSPQFLDVEKFPNAFFEGTKIEGDKISGMLTIKGVPHAASFRIQEMTTERIVLKGTLDRNDYGISFNKTKGRKKIKTIGDTVELTIDMKLQ